MNILILISILVLIICVISIIVCHYSIKVSRYNVKNEKLPSGFDGIKILHLSDLHSRVFGKDNKKLVSLIVKENPNIIVMTGDMVNGRYDDIIGLENLIRCINENKSNSCIIYYIMGNREFRYNKENHIELKDMLTSNNVIVLENDKNELRIGNESICIYGLNYYNRDSNVYYSDIQNYTIGKKKEIKNDIKDIIGKADVSKYNILLVHDPNEFEKASDIGFDLVLAGHIHGGVIRIPLIGGVLSPQIKLFPKYDGGMFKYNKSIMCVSRGLGYGTIPFRLFNRPEIVYIKLNKG